MSPHHLLLSPTLMSPQTGSSDTEQWEFIPASDHSGYDPFFFLIEQPLLLNHNTELIIISTINTQLLNNRVYHRTDFQIIRSHFFSQ